MDFFNSGELVSSQLTVIRPKTGSIFAPLNFWTKDPYYYTTAGTLVWTLSGQVQLCLIISDSGPIKEHFEGESDFIQSLADLVKKNGRLKI